MTGKTPAEPDNSGYESYAITDVESIAKAVIRQAPDKAHRWLAWKAFTASMQDDWELTAEYPWEQPEKATRVSLEHARYALLKMLEVIPDTAEQARLARVTAAECEKVETRMESGIPADTDKPAGSLPVRYCGHCAKPFRPRKPSAKWCSPSCRTANWKQKQAARQR